MKKSTLDLSKLSDQFTGVTAKVPTVLRNVTLSDMTGIIQNKTPELGDIVLAKVTSVGDKNILQTREGRPVELHVGDNILAAYANRYAVEEYESLIPDDLQECHLVSAGGVASRIVKQNKVMGSLTTIKPVGILKGANGQAMNIRHYAMNPWEIDQRSRPITIAILGTGMDAGKTTAASDLVKGMTRAGEKVGFGKMTGTGLSSDIHKPQDAGAIAVCDFVDMGYPSTYKAGTQEIINILKGLTTSLSLRGTTVNIIEMADGVFQSDNQALLQSDDFKSKIDGVLLAADTGLSAKAAIEELHKHDIPVLALCGCTMRAPLSVQEFTRHVNKDAAPQFGALDREDLQKSGVAKEMLAFIEANRGETTLDTDMSLKAEATKQSKLENA
ncbi:MAG: DUF1611 domain-containing protein [Zetaproteobacteria bacterium]|nr:MAG: DUF1611 domain-containing protein [Zetaproteobacteria bacterium]